MCRGYREEFKKASSPPLHQQQSPPPPDIPSESVLTLQNLVAALDAIEIYISSHPNQLHASIVDRLKALMNQAQSIVTPDTTTTTTTPSAHQ